MTKESSANTENKIAEAIKERREWFESQQPPCPIDGSPGSFQRYEGAYTRVRGVFECKKNRHEFYYG